MGIRVNITNSVHKLVSRIFSFHTMLKHVARRSLATTACRREFRDEPCMADSMIDIGTRRIFDSDHDQFRETVRKWFNNEVKPNHAAWEEKGVVPREIWESAGENGLLGCNTPVEYGGIGADLLYAAIVWEEQSYANASGPGFPLHSDIVMPYLLNFGTEEQKNRFLPEMTKGKIISAIAMTEPSAGSDLQGIKTYARKDGDDWILNGSKTFITNGQNADLVIVVAITNPKAKIAAHGISLFLVERGMEGFKRGQNLKKMGMKAQDTSELFFEDVRLPASSILGGEKGVNRGFMMLMNELPQERLMIGDGAVSKCEFLYETTRDYILDRKAFGGSISKMQVIRHQMAELKTKITIGRSFTDQCIELHCQKKLNTSMASMNKYAMTELEGEVADRCVQLHGGWGYMWEYDVARAYADARVQRIYGGTTEIMKEIISRDLPKKK